MGRGLLEDACLGVVGLPGHGGGPAVDDDARFPGVYDSLRIDFTVEIPVRILPLTTCGEIQWSKVSNQ